MEDGEINDNDTHHPGNALTPDTLIESNVGYSYSPALEWPGEGIEPSVYSSGDFHSSWYAPDDYDASSSPGASPHTHSTTFLRLLVERSSILPRKQTLAVIDGFNDVQVGRDMAPPGSVTPRIRLKEMEVSKFHATVYWDQERREWAVVDMGSKHGTFLKSHRRLAPSAGAMSSSTVTALPTSGPSNDRGVRLSPPRIASIPRRIQHLDRLSVGGTTFIAHIHEDSIPCADCSPQGGDEIPLLNTPKADQNSDASRKRKREADALSYGTTSLPPAERDSKKALSMLKRTLLSRHDASATKVDASRYTDRSARRRALHPDAPPEIPHTDSRHPPGPSAVSSAPATSLATRPVSAPPAPLPETNIGHRLLMKQGWQPGTGLGQVGSSDIVLVDPLSASGNTGRAGLGMSGTNTEYSSEHTPLDWKEGGKLRRWADFKPT
ncbi:uncharacterized protein FIBRA_06467 [Fibroporia radiculosa]|uniref:G-patch domain-containing protein n=1 Tax=Fibroporia radiculosa TaxID=599839 RepID=J4IBA0_9APHY|nr:uncharacterized protein FIBRA_06467 [Fibroporia radiculosa]CCM04296.1 predicted protein [Fibroporia radiculosa]